MDKYKYEFIFKNSKNSDELFDAFDNALKENIDDIETYKLLFWNPALDINMLSMFVKKLANTFPNIAYDVYMWGAKVIELSFDNVENYETILNFYKKAADLKPLENEPYIKAIDAYNFELKIHPPAAVINFLKKGITKVKDPSTLYFKLSEFFGKLGNTELKNHYLSEGEKYLRKKFRND